MSWTSEVIETLCVFKRAGSTFEEAWAVAMFEHRPPLRAQAVGDGLTTLFDLDGSVPDDEPLVEFVRRVAEDAWFGRRPVLAHLRGVVDGLGAGDDWSEAAVRVGGGSHHHARGRVAA